MPRCSDFSALNKQFWITYSFEITRNRGSVEQFVYSTRQKEANREYVLVAIRRKRKTIPIFLLNLIG
jgi:hypothetical protein